MKVMKNEQVSSPGYPNRRQFLNARTLLGIAAIGLGAVAGRGDDMRLGGDIAIEPRDPAPTAVAPKAGCTASNLPPSTVTTNAPATPAQPKEAPVTNSPLPSLKGVMPAPK